LTEQPHRAVLVTRPEPGASETAAKLAALGFCAVLAPVLRIRPIPARLPAPERVAAVLVTSGQAIGAIPDTYRAARLFAVGDATAARARATGFADVISAAGDADDLAATVRNTIAPGATLLLVTGQGLGHPLAASLRAAGYAVIRRSVYAPMPVRRLPVPALRALRSGQVTAALFFSADSAACFAAMVSRITLQDSFGNTDAVAISPGAAVALKGLHWRRILVAARPNQDAMLALLR
jgi:uroporphyrinogen-III synthase